MGLGAVVSAAKAPNRHCNSFPARLHPCLSIGSARGFGDGLLSDTWRVPVLRSPSDENLWCRRSAFAWWTYLRGGWSVASKFFAMACSCFGDGDTRVLDRSRNRGMTGFHGNRSGTMSRSLWSNLVCGVGGTPRSSFVRLRLSSSYWCVLPCSPSLSSGERTQKWARFSPPTSPTRCCTMPTTGVREATFRSSCGARHSSRERGDGDGVCCLIDEYDFPKRHW